MSKKEINLTSEQQDAISQLISFFYNTDIYEENEDSIFLSGPAGAGKTTIIGDFLKKINNANIFYSAPTHKACNILNSVVRQKVNTILSTLGYSMEYDENGDLQRVRKGKFRYYKEMKNSDLNSYLLIIDEASMIDSQLFEELDEIEIKKIYLGDEYQLPPVNEDISEVFDLPKISLKEIMRTGDEGIKEINYMLRNSIEKEIGCKVILKKLKKTKYWCELYNEKNKQKSIYYIMGMLLRKKTTFQIIVYTNKRKTFWNNWCKKKLKNIYNTENEWIEGMPIISNKTFFYYNSVKEINNNNVIFNYIKLTVEDNDNLLIPSSSTFVIKNVKRGIIRKNENINAYFKINKDIEIYLLTCMTEEEGDDYIYNFIKIVDENDQKYFRNKAVIKRDEIKEYLKKNRNLSSQYWKEYFKYYSYYDTPIDFSVAITSHKSQGSSFENVFVDVSDILGTVKPSENDKRRSLYVGISRTKKNLYLF